MTRYTMRIAALLVFAAAPAALAQQPGGAPAQPPHGPGAGAMGMHGAPGMTMMMHEGGLASMLLAHTAELGLNDQQVTRLAAIARRTVARHRAMHAGMDSAMRANPQGGATPSGAPMPPEQMQARMRQMHDQERADVRDALAVLTPDQQADAWMMHDMHAMAMMHMHMMHGMGGMGAMGGAPCGHGMMHPGAEGARHMGPSSGASRD